MSPQRGEKGKGQVKYKRNLKSLRDVYEEACIEFSVAANSSMLSVLPDHIGVELESDCLNLSSNYVGDRGMSAVLSVVQKSPHLTKMVFTDNGLRNNAVKNLSNTLCSHPGVTHLDLSDNYISEGAGNSLERLLTENTRITSLEILNTKINTDQRLKLKAILAQNAAKAVVVSEH